MLANLVGWLIYTGALAGLLFLGWNEPLRYRFISRAEIYTLEHPATPAPAPSTPSPGAWMKAPTRKTKLDEVSPGSVRSRYLRPTTPYPATTR